MAAFEAPAERHGRPPHAIRRRHWAVVLAALAVFLGLVAVLREPAVRPAPVAAAAPTLPASRLPAVCLSRQLLCDAPALPSGFPCSCIHPLRGTVPGTIVPMSEARGALGRAGFSRPPLLDSSGLGEP
jgi:hypothetical protein